MNILAVDDEYYALELLKHALAEVAGNARSCAIPRRVPGRF